MFEDLFCENGLSLERLVSLCWVAEHGSIARAAENAPGISQPRITKHIRELESYFGGKTLVNRGNQKAPLTAEGKRLQALALPFLRLIDDLRCEMGSKPRVLVIGASESLIQRFLMPVIWPSLFKGVSDCTVRFQNLQVPGIIEAIEDRRIDLGFLPASQAQLAQLPSSLPITSEFRLFVPKAMKRNLAGPISVGQLSGLPLATLEGQGLLRRTLDSAASQHGLKLDIRLECTSMTQVAVAVEGGHLCGLLPSDFRKRLSSSTQDHSVVGLESLSDDLCFAWNEAHFSESQLLRRSIEIIEHQLAKSSLLQ